MHNLKLLNIRNHTIRLNETLVLDHMMEGCQIIGFDWKYIYLNDAADVHNRRPKEELLGKSYMEIWPGVEKTEVYKVIRDSLEGRKHHEMENEFIFPDGASAWFELRIQPVPEGVFILSIDITERKQAIQKLDEGEKLFRNLFENMLNGFAYCKMISEEGKPLDFVYLNVNEAFATLTGLVDVNGKRVSEVIPGIQEADPELLEKYNRVSSTGIPEVFETYVESLKMWFAISVYSPQKGYFVAVFDVITKRKIAEEKLQESNEFLSNLFNYANTPIIVWDRSLIITRFNHAFEALSGYCSEEVIGKKIDFLFAKESSESSMYLINSTLSGNRWESVEIEIQRKYGDSRIVQWNSANIHDKDGKTILATIAQGHDITERQNIEKTLKESEDKFRKAFLTNPDSITITRLDNGTYVSVNNGFIQIFGYSEEEVIGKTPIEISIWHNPDDRKQFIHELETNGNVGNFETKFYSKNRKLRDCLISATTINLKGVIHVLSTTRDITERKNAELALLDSEERFRTLYENVTIGIYRTTTDGHILMANPALIRMLGFDSFDQLAHRNLEHEGYEPDYPRSEFMKTIKKEGKIIGLESAWNKRNGNTLFVRESAKAVKEANGHILYIDGTVEDITDRKKAEEALLESEDKFKYIFDHSVIGKSITYPSGDIHVNKAFCDMLGYSEEELEKAKWQNITHPDDINRTEKELRSLISGKNESTRFIKRYLHKNGSVIWTDVSTSLRRDVSDKPLYFMTSVIDITERKMAEEALRESEERFSKSFKTSPISFMIADMEDGRIIEVNDAFTSISGFSREEALGNTTLNMKIWVHEEDRKHMIDSLSKGKAILHKETRLRSKEGKVAIVLFSAQVIKLANRNCIISSIEDITERKHAEEALLESEERFRSMANSIPQLAWVAHADGFIYWYNQRWYEYTGTKPEQMEGWGWQNVHDPAFLPKVMENWTASIASGQLFEMSFPLRGADGQFRTFLTRVYPMKDSKGRVVQWFGTNTDVETLKQAEEIINKLNEELEQKVMQRTELLVAANKELEAFSYSVSHDLRAPLRSVHGFTKILMEDYEAKLDEEGRRICGIISSSASQMGELIDDLLSFSRIGRTSLNHSQIDMEKMTRVLFEGITSRAERKRIKLKIGKLHNSFGDVKLLGQVWTNLISNAIKYTSKNEIAKIRVASTSSNKMITYSIKDNGVGFDMQYAHKLFGIFQRLHSEAEFEGNGVGLAIIQRIILKHGGQVWAEGEPGNGATFYFSLPVNGTGS